MQNFNKYLHARLLAGGVARLIVLVLIGLLAACGGDSTQLNTKRISAADAGLNEDLTTAFQSWARDTGMIGASVKIRQGMTGFEWQDTYGVVSVDRRQPYGLDTQMRVASATKPMTAVVVLQLVQEGMLSLDDTLSQWFSDYPRGNEITIRHLLQHRSGIYDVTLDDAVFQGFVLTNMAVWLEPAEILRWTYDSTLPLITSISQGVEIPREAANAPGEGYHYSQPGFIALGYIVEHVTGQTLTEVYAERIFTPLQMTRSFMVGRDTPSTPITYVYLAQQFGNSLVPTTLFGSFDGIASASFSAGGVVSTTNDLMLFFSALMNGELLSEESMQAMQAFEVSDPEGYGITKVGYYGLGFARQIRDGYNMRGHNGSMPGSGSVMQYVEEYDLYITATRNTDAYPATHPDFVDFGMNDLVNNIVTAVRD